MQPVKPRPDPAPSRWSYRMQRLMLTPLFRTVLRVGVPFAFSFAALWVWLSDQENHDRVMATYHEMRAAIEARPEFRVRLMAIDGAGAPLSEDIREILSLDFPQSSFDLDLAAIQRRVRELPAVAAADVRIRSGGVLQIDVTEREAAALWRTPDGLDKLDAEGVVIGSVLERAEAPELPLIAGKGASERVTQALALVEAVAPLAPRLRGLVRIGARRWDVMLDRGQRIMLPAERPVQALERVIALDQAQEMMARDIAVVDMRIAHRPTIRLRPSARDEWWRISRMSWGDSSQ
jgi:cell division protein FtsQ